MATYLSFQRLIMVLQEYWANQGCAIVSTYDMEVGAGTFHPATVLRCLGSKPWRAAYVQPSRRPGDSRFGEHPNRLHKHHQFQVILKPAPENIQELYLGSLKAIGIDSSLHDVRFVEDNWESPSLGASGLGWEVWCDGMEISQFTYMQQMGGIQCELVAGEITYGLERVAMYAQNIDNIHELAYNDSSEFPLKYGDVFKKEEYQLSEFCLNQANVEALARLFQSYEAECFAMLEKKLELAAYEYCVKSSHVFNLLDSRGVISVTERASYIAKIRAMTKSCCQAWLDSTEPQNK